MTYAPDHLGHDIAKLGFGLMRLPGTQGGGEPDLPQVCQMADEFLEAGGTYFDTAYVYDGGKSEAALKAAVVDRHPRESFQVATKLNAWLGKPDEATAKAQFDISLKRTGAGYFDYYLLHALQSDNHQIYDDFGLWDFVRAKQQDGLVRNWGFSFHAGPELLRQVLDTHPRPDFIQLQINYADWEDAGVAARANYEICAEEGIPVVVMEPLRGGALANPPEAVAAPLRAANPQASMASWGIRYAASLPGVITVLSGMSNLEQMRDNLSYMRDFQPITSEEREAVTAAQQVFAGIESIPCTGCGYCLADCPIHMKIPGIFTAANREIIYGMTENAKRLYGMNTAEVRASDCLQCGACEDACPQRIPIIDWLERVADLLED